jgi:hypothetical protein
LIAAWQRLYAPGIVARLGPACACEAQEFEESPVNVDRDIPLRVVIGCLQLAELGPWPALLQGPIPAD